MGRLERCAVSFTHMAYHFLRSHLRHNYFWIPSYFNLTVHVSTATRSPRTRARCNRWTRRHIPGAPRTMKLTGNTSEMLRHYVGNRKKGHLFLNGRTGKRLTLLHFEKMVDKWARLLNIRGRRQSIMPGGKRHHPLTLIGLMERKFSSGPLSLYSAV